jgi:hypothetical protein
MQARAPSNLGDGHVLIFAGCRLRVFEGDFTPSVTPQKERECRQRVTH